MPNVMIIDSDLTRARGLRDRIEKIIPRIAMELAHEAITTIIPSEPEIDGEVVLFFCEKEGKERREDKACAQAISENSGIKVKMITSECRSVMQVNGQHLTAGYLAVHANVERSNEIVKKLKDWVCTCKSYTAFDVERHVLEIRQGTNFPAPPYIIIVSTSPDSIEKIIRLVLFLGISSNLVFHKNIIEFVTIDNLE